MYVIERRKTGHGGTNTQIRQITGVILMTDTEISAMLIKTPELGRRALFNEYCNYVYAVAANKLGSCGSREDIEECVSDIFAEVFRFFKDKPENGSGFKPVIATIAKRRAIDAYRKLSRGRGMTVPIDSDDMRELPSGERIDEAAEQKDERNLILRKIAELGEPDSTIIMQQYFYHRTAKQIAEAVSMTAMNVQKRSSRARMKLRELLTEAGISY